MRLVPSNSIGKRLIIFIPVLLLFCSWGTVGQTEDQLGVRLKKLVTFEIRPGIVVFPTFTTGGDVCRMVIEKKQYIDSSNPDFDRMIPSDLVDRLVDEVVPPNERGKPSKYLSSESYIAGGAAFIKQDYENVSVGVYGTSIVGKKNGAYLIVINWQNRTCPSTQ